MRLEGFHRVSIQLDSYTLLNQVDANHDANAFCVSNQRAFESLQRPGMDAHLLADCEAAIRLKFLPVQSRTKSLDLKIGQPCRFSLGADK